MTNIYLVFRRLLLIFLSFSLAIGFVPEKPIVAATTEWLRQTEIPPDGKTAWWRDCNYDANHALVNCTTWASGSLTNVRGIGNEAYRGYQNFVYKLANGQQKGHQSFVSADSLFGYTRLCNVANGVWSSCGAWTTFAFATPTYRDMAAYAYKANAIDKIRQVLLGVDTPTTITERNCNLDPNTGGFSSCIWTTPVPWVGVNGVNLPGSKSYTGVATHVYHVNGAAYLRQSLVESNGRFGWTRYCLYNEVNATADWNTCRGPASATSGPAVWQQVDLTALYNLQNGSFPIPLSNVYDNFIFEKTP